MTTGVRGRVWAVAVMREDVVSEELLLTLRKFVVPEFVFGRGALALTGRQSAGLGVRRALLVADPGLLPFGWPDKVAESLRKAGVDVHLFTAISANPRVSEVMAGAACFDAAACDALVAVGGGSAMDCAKAIGIVVANKRNILCFEGVDNVERPGPPLLCVPTTAGSGAEVSQFAIVTDSDRRVKVAIASKTLIPDAAFIDPEVTVTMPPALTAYSGLDALTHAMEAYVSNAHAPMTDLLAKEAIRLVRTHLVRAIAVPDDMEARAGMLLASLYAGIAFSNAILGAIHAMAHTLGGLLDLPHGLCKAILMEHVVAFNYEAAANRYDQVGLLLGAVIEPGMPQEERKAAVLRSIRTIREDAGITVSLQDLGVPRDALPTLAAQAVTDPCMLTNPRQPRVSDIEGIYESAYQSRT